MNSRHKTIRAMISVMCPERAIDYIKAFDLPDDEEKCLIEREVRRRSCIQIAQKFNMSEEQVKRARQRAFVKMADKLDYDKEKAGA